MKTGAFANIEFPSTWLNLVLKDATPFSAASATTCTEIRWEGSTHESVEGDGHMIEGNVHIFEKPRKLLSFQPWTTKSSDDWIDVNAPCLHSCGEIERDKSFSASIIHTTYHPIDHRTLFCVRTVLVRKRRNGCVTIMLIHGHTSRR